MNIDLTNCQLPAHHFQLLEKVYQDLWRTLYMKKISFPKQESCKFAHNSAFRQTAAAIPMYDHVSSRLIIFVQIVCISLELYVFHSNYEPTVPIVRGK
jgi:hypothetical protein